MVDVSKLWGGFLLSCAVLCYENTHPPSPTHTHKHIHPHSHPLTHTPTQPHPQKHPQKTPTPLVDQRRVLDPSQTTKTTHPTLIAFQFPPNCETTWVCGRWVRACMCVGVGWVGACVRVTNIIIIMVIIIIMLYRKSCILCNGQCCAPPKYNHHTTAQHISSPTHIMCSPATPPPKSHIPKLAQYKPSEQKPQHRGDFGRPENGQHKDGCCQKCEEIQS